MRKVFYSLISILLISSCFASRINADDTTYQVFVDDGLYGNVVTDQYSNGLSFDTDLSFGRLSGSDDYLVYDKDNTSKVYFRITSSDPKYYVKGIHISGKYLDEDDLLKETTVDQDLYLVPSFGVKGEVLKYKVYYFTEDGQNLLTLSGSSEEYEEYEAYYNERVLVGARAFDGYEDYVVYRGSWSGWVNTPTKNREGATKGFTGTIDENNTVIEYYYRENVGGETIIDDGTVVYVEEGGGTAGGGAGGGGGAAPVTPSEPAEVIDIDEPEIPQAEPEPTPTPGPEPIIEPEPVPAGFWETVLSNPLLFGGLGLGAALLLFFLLFVLRRKKDE